ncbi:hypothetical protein LX32DRAFT_717418, partial [Colletotrichum zoysiae]
NATVATSLIPTLARQLRLTVASRVLVIAAKSVVTAGVLMSLLMAMRHLLSWLPLGTSSRLGATLIRPRPAP